MDSETCVVCHDTVLVELESDSEVEGSGKDLRVLQSVLDDVEPSCGCHYHWYVPNCHCTMPY